MKDQACGRCLPASFSSVRLLPAQVRMHCREDRCTAVACLLSFSGLRLLPAHVTIDCDDSHPLSFSPPPPLPAALLRPS